MILALNLAIARPLLLPERLEFYGRFRLSLDLYG